MHRIYSAAAPNPYCNTSRLVGVHFECDQQCSGLHVEICAVHSTTGPTYRGQTYRRTQRKGGLLGFHTVNLRHNLQKCNSLDLLLFAQPGSKSRDQKQFGESGAGAVSILLQIAEAGGQMQK